MQGQALKCTEYKRGGVASSALRRALEPARRAQFGLVPEWLEPLTRASLPFFGESSKLETERLARWQHLLIAPSEQRLEKGLILFFKLLAISTKGHWFLT